MNVWPGRVGWAGSVVAFAAPIRWRPCRSIRTIRARPCRAAEARSRCTAASVPLAPPPTIAMTGPRLPGSRPGLPSIGALALRAGEPASVVEQRRRAGADDDVGDLAHHELVVAHGDQRVPGADQVRGGAGQQRQAARPRAPPGGRAEPVRSLAGGPGRHLFLAVAYQVHREGLGGSDPGAVGGSVPDVEGPQRAVPAGRALTGTRQGDPGPARS